MLNRNENGKLRLKSLNLEIFIGDLFMECKSESGVTWLQEQLQGCIEKIAEERLEEI